MVRRIAAMGAAILGCLTLSPAMSQERLNAPIDASSAHGLDEFRSDVLRDLEARTAPIRSDGDLRRFLSESDGSALDRLPPVARAEFVESLRFGSKGLHTLNGALLERHLTPSETHDVLALFGLRGLVFSFDNVRSQTALDRSVALLQERKLSSSDKGAFPRNGTQNSRFGGCADCPEVIENAVCDGKANCKNCSNCGSNCIVANCTYNGETGGI